MKRAATTIHDDILLEILFHVSTDVADLFRCAATCKRWCALIADPSFLRRRWPENACHPLSLLGFFVQQQRSQDDNDELFICVDDMDALKPRQPPFFVPAQTRQPLGARRRFLSSIITGAPAGLLDGAMPLTARGGLLLVCLERADSVWLAVCDPLAGTCDVLPPLNCPVTAVSCAILTNSDYCSSDELQQRKPAPRYSTFFMVQTVIDYIDEQLRSETDLYTFSSAKPSWSAPTRCFNKPFLYGKDGFTMAPSWQHGGVVTCRGGGMTHWLAACISNDGKSATYHTFNVRIETGRISLTELSISAADQLSRRDYGWPRLSVAVDGGLMLSHVYIDQAGLPRLDIWTRRGDDGSRENGTSWLHVGAFNLKLLTDPCLPRVWSGEKSGTMLILDAIYWRVHKLDTQTGVMEDVTKLFPHSLCIDAVPMEIDWPALFLSRLGGNLC